MSLLEVQILRFSLSIVFKHVKFYLFSSKFSLIVTHSYYYYYYYYYYWHQKIGRIYELNNSEFTDISLIFPHPRYFVPLRPKCSLQRPILKHLQPMFLPHCERPCFTPLKKRKIILFLSIYFWIASCEAIYSTQNVSKRFLTSACS